MKVTEQIDATEASAVDPYKFLAATRALRHPDGLDREHPGGAGLENGFTANWKVNGLNRWTVPFGWSFGRIVRVGKLPINAQLGAYYNLINPQDLPYGKWQVRLQVAMLFPKSK